MRGFVDSLSRDDMSEGYMLLWKAMVSSNVFWNTICGNKHWKRFFHWMRPAFIMPDRHAMGGSFLQQEHAILKVS